VFLQLFLILVDDSVHCVCVCVCLFNLDEEITLDSLMEMTEETLKSVVPKAGPRALFLSKIRAVSNC